MGAHQVGAVGRGGQRDGAILDGADAGRDAIERPSALDGAAHRLIGGRHLDEAGLAGNDMQKTAPDQGEGRKAEGRAVQGHGIARRCHPVVRESFGGRRHDVLRQMES